MALVDHRTDPSPERWTRWSERFVAPGLADPASRARAHGAAMVCAELTATNLLFLPAWALLVPALAPLLAVLAVLPLAGLPLVRRGRDRLAVLLASGTLAVAWAALARATGGTASPAIVGLAAVPALPALLRDRRGVAAQGVATLAIVGVLVAAEAWGYRPSPAPTGAHHAALVATVVAALCTGIVLTIWQLGAFSDRAAVELHRANRELAAAREVATHASAAKTEFLASMSHELRTPMNAVIGMSGLLAQSTLDGRQKEQVEAIRSSATALVEIIDEILDFSRLESGRLRLDPAPFELVVLVRQVSELLRVRAREKGLRLDVEVDPRVPSRLIADAGRVRQVLFNLVGNAVKYTDHGSVALRVQCLERDHRTARVRIEVADTGIGIAREDLARVFDRFQQVGQGLEYRVGGTGLGLAITRQIVELMGGRLGVESQLGAGSTFRVDLKLPLAATETAKTAPDLDPEPLPAARVLLVEDNPTNRKVMLAMLDRLGCAGDTAEHGQQAIDRLASHTYDLVLMDCEMPVLDGYEATRRLRADGRTLPILALTGHTGPEARRRAEDAGMNDVLEKPVRLDTLHRVLSHWLSR